MENDLSVSAVNSVVKRMEIMENEKLRMENDLSVYFSVNPVNSVVSFPG